MATRQAAKYGTKTQTVTTEVDGQTETFDVTLRAITHRGVSYGAALVVTEARPVCAGFVLLAGPAAWRAPSAAEALIWLFIQGLTRAKARALLAEAKRCAPPVLPTSRQGSAADLSQAEHDLYWGAEGTAEALREFVLQECERDARLADRFRRFLMDQYDQDLVPRARPTNDH